MRLDALVQDLRFALRLLARDGRFTATVIAVVGLGIGVSHLFFTLTYAHTVRGLPMAAIGRVLHVSALDLQANGRGMSYPDFVDLRRGQRSFEDLAAFANVPVALGERGRAAERAEATYTTAAAFTMSRARPVIGRVFHADDDVPGREPVVVLVERLWRARYGGDPGVLGRVVEVDGTPATVVGVVPDASGFPSAAAIWLPLAQMPGVAASSRDARTLQVFGRLRAGATVAAAQDDLARVGATLAASFPESHRGIRLRIVPLNERFLASRAGWLPFMIAGVIMASVASINVGNLLMVRSARRVRELAIRTSLGASRWRLVRQLLMEATLVAAAGAAVGLLLSRALVAFHERNIPEPFHPYWAHYSLDATVLLAVVGLLVATVLVAAVAPAWLAARVQPAAVLKDGRGDPGRRLGRAAATAMIAVQLALTIVLTTQLGLATVEARRRTIPTDAALDRSDVLTATFTLPDLRYASADERRAFHARLLETLRMLPGVSAAALASHLPLAGARERRLRIAGRDATPGQTPPTVWTVDVTAGYFDALAIGAVRGRVLTDADATAGAPGVVINERLASLFFAGADPLGRIIALDTSTGERGAERTVVGVVPDVRQHTTPDPRPLVYLPLSDAAPAGAAIVLRSTAAASVAPALREAFGGLAPLVPLNEVQSLAAARWNVQWVGRMSERLAMTVVASTVLLAIAGLYAVISHRVVLRTREIGVRMALGARPHQIAALVGRSVRAALVVGLALGFAGVLAWTRAFSPDRLTDAAVVGRLALAAGLSLAAIAVAAAALPARRATQVDPLDVMRCE